MAGPRRLFRFLTFLLSVVGLALLFLPTLPFKNPKVEQGRLKIFSKWCRMILRVFGVRVTHHYLQDQDCSRVIVANHVSYLDIPVVASLGPTLFLAKEEVARWPLIGPVSQALGMLFVKRESLRDRAAAIKKIATKLEQNYSVTVFPEGTTSTTGPQRGRIPYFGGAFRAARMKGRPVEVLYLEYEPLETAAWLGDDPFVGHLWSLLGHKNIQVKIRRELLPALTNREAQVQSYFWTRSWILEGGHGLLSSEVLRLPQHLPQGMLYKDSDVPVENWRKELEF